MIFLDFKELFNSQKDWNLSQNPDFFTTFNDLKWNGVEIGTTFIPEVYENGRDENKMYLALKFILDVLKMRHIRLGIRWNQVFENGKIDLKYYKKLIKFLLKKDVKITLCLGPIKSPGWPEQFVPKEILDKTKNKDGENLSDDFVKEQAVAYLHDLITILKWEIGTGLIKKIQNFQIDNEPFNKFGEVKFDLDKEYLARVILILKKEFGQEIDILINSAGRLDLQKFYELKKTCQETNFTLGLNYYYAVDNLVNLPKFYLFNSNTIGNWGDFTVRKIHNLRSQNFFKLEVTEAQMEPWGRADFPGNSLQSLVYVLLQTARFLKMDQNWPVVIRVWGVEKLVEKYIENKNNSEHDNMVDLIRFLNDKKNFKGTERGDKLINIFNKISQ